MNQKTASLYSGKHLRVRSMNPQKFALWLFIISITMIFASLTSAYVVKKSSGDWIIFQFPELFKLTTVFIILSSFTMHFAYLAAKKNNLFQIRLGIVLTTLLAAAFTIGQYLSWGELVQQDIYFVGNPAGSFIYIFTGLHVLHLLGGVVFLGIVLIRAFKYRVHSKNLLSIEMCTTYWHFLGGLWLYLYLFLIANN
jgi:cytochrome c oxidase subunit 3